MNARTSLTLAAVLLALLRMTPTLRAALTPDNLRCEQRTNPVGIDARVFTLTVTPKSGAPQAFPDLPISGKDFHEVHWLGFSSTATSDTVFHLDNLRIGKHSAE